jgi:hypothetical protein
MPHFVRGRVNGLHDHKLAQQIAAGILKVQIGRVFQIDQIAEAHRLMRSADRWEALVFGVREWVREDFHNGSRFK